MRLVAEGEWSSSRAEDGQDPLRSRVNVRDFGNSCGSLYLSLLLPITPDDPKSITPLGPERRAHRQRPAMLGTAGLRVEVPVVQNGRRAAAEATRASV